MKKFLLIHTDGGARGNPGPAAIGVLIGDSEGREIARFGEKIGRTTNNVAEYRAVIAALEWVLKNAGEKIEGVKFYLDSSLVVNQLNGLFRVKENHLRELIFRVRELEQAVEGNISYHYVPRSENKIADGLVNASLDDLNQ
jgi:ribonuclease HI